MQKLIRPVLLALLVGLVNSGGARASKQRRRPKKWSRGSPT